MESTECGSVCLSIILAYFGHKLSPDEVREACGVSRDGSKASYILRAARTYKLIAHGYNIQNLRGLDACPWPCIVHWNFDHFVVFEGRRGHSFYINDPAYGRRRVDRDEFDKAFTGVALTLIPDKGFQKKRQKSPLLLFFRYALKGGLLALFAAVLLGILQILPSLAIAGATKGFIDYVFLKSLYHWTPPLAIVVIIAVSSHMILMFVQQRLLMRLHVHFKINLASKIIHRLFYLPLTFFDQRLSGDVLYRFASLQNLSDLLSLGVMGAFINLISFCFFAIILYAISPILFNIVCVFIALRILVFAYYKNRMAEKNTLYIQDTGRLSGIEMNGLQSIEMLKANNLENVFFKNWAANHDETLNKFKATLLIDQRYSLLLSLFATLMPLALLYKGSLLVMEGGIVGYTGISIGTLIAFMTLANGLDQPLMTLLEFSGSLEKIKASISRLHDILLYKIDDTMINAHSSVVLSLRKEIIFNNITFGYSTYDPPLFENMSFRIAKGKTTAIVGASGSGKSTLSKLLCGLYTPKSGQIYWDRIPIAALSPHDRSKLIALVDQDIFFFEGTVRDNLSSWNHDVRDDDLLKALKDVGLYDDLLGRGLLNAVVAENGANFSGGQRQRLEIARAFAAHPDIFILDEATSALDSLSEKKVFDMLSEKNATLLIIAHRLSTIQNADIIYVLDKGQIVQSGRHHDLLNQPGLYRTLFEREALS
ncbi:MAG: ATP-binding cassette domain-containing protein [Alphaproteobacteria bacterium]|nr:ATP-binding cassette domain-containing protein [Alphaproteobacteria bacterium]